MPSAKSYALQLTRQLLTVLQNHKGPILASPEEADFFRKHYKKTTRRPPPIIAKTPPPIETPPPPLLATPVAPPLPPSKKIALEEPPPLPPPAPIRSEIRLIFEKIAPHFPLIADIPNDSQAQKIAHRWKTKNQSAPISILSYAEPPEHKKFLEHMARAIDLSFGSAKLIVVDGIEKEKQWEAFLSVPDLKWILCCDYTLWQLSELMRHFREIPASSKRFLGKVPLFLLPDLTLYLKDPLLKRSLWKALCQTLASS
ncbi:MAG: hypothetical protein HY069_01470 [Chlamydiia bacterium]|nr:hypothetical protein [Chlamydiia bacterium]